MKLAHVILAHAHPGHLRRMIGRLSHPDSDCYVHVDAKADITPFLPIAELGNVYFIRNRQKITWGSYSMVQATINSFEEVLASGKKYGHINLLSGQDYPIKSATYIHKFFSDNQGKIFISYRSIMDEWTEAIPRVTKYFLTHYRFKGHYRAETLMNKLLPQRKMPKGIVAVGRSQWFTATPEAISYMLGYLKNERWVSRFFKLSWAPDEIIFQTILYNSPFRKDMINDNMVYLDWSKGDAHPKVLTMADEEKLKNTHELFARKFDPDDAEILDFLDDIASP